MDSSVSGIEARPVGKESWSPSAGSMGGNVKPGLADGRGDEEAGGAIESAESFSVTRPGRTGRIVPGRVGTGAVTPGMTSNGRVAVAEPPAGLVAGLTAGLGAEEGCRGAGAGFVAGGSRAGGESGGPESWASTRPAQQRKTDGQTAKTPLVIATFALRTVHANNRLGLGWTYRPQDQALPPFFLYLTRFIAGLCRAAVTTGFFRLSDRVHRKNCQAGRSVDKLPKLVAIRRLCPPVDVLKRRTHRSHAHRAGNHRHPPA